MPTQPPLPLVWGIAALALASLGVLIVLGARWQNGLPVLRFSPRRVAPWTALDMLLVVIVYVGLQLACMGVASLFLSPQVPVDDKPPSGIEVAIPPKLLDTDLIPMMLSLTVANVLILVGAAKVVRWRTGATLADMGFATSRLLPDIGLGLVAFLAALLPVYAIQAVLTQFLPSQHPVVSLLSGESQIAQMLLVAVSAVIVAPVVEEFLFRGLLQGWLEAIDVKGRDEKKTASHPELDEPEPVTEASSLHTDSVDQDPNPYRAPPHVGGEPPQSPLQTAASPPPRKWPIIVSSLAFALVHWGHGPDPIPLFVLSLVLGYLYRQTHRLWPCIVLHMALNGLSLLVLWVTLKFGHLPVN